MRLHPDFLLRKIGKNAVLVPFGQKLIDFNGMITLNRTGAFIAEELQKENISRETLIQRIVDHFEIGIETAAIDTDQFLADLRSSGALDESVL